MKKNSTLKFYNSIFLSLIGLLIICVGVYLLVENYLNNTLNTQISIIGVAIIIMGFILIFCMKYVRISSRAQMNLGNYDKQNYNNISDKERKRMDMLNMIEDNQILPWYEYEHNMVQKVYDYPEDILTDLIGLDNVKTKIIELESQMKHEKKENRKAFHMCFLGNPGTGKTTVAKIIASYLVKYKNIKSKELIVTDAASILACSNPLRKLTLILQKANNKVLFIDEAYTFAFDKRGQECLALLINQIENSRANMSIILAGYKKEMKYLFDMNSGLQSRINTYFFFKDYDQFEMKQIFDKLAANKKIIISDAAQEKLMKIYIWKRIQPQFANGRTVRKIFEDAMLRHYYNLENGIIDKKSKNILCEEDIIETSEEEENYFS